MIQMFYAFLRGYNKKYTIPVNYTYVKFTQTPCIT